MSGKYNPEEDPTVLAGRAEKEARRIAIEKGVERSEWLNLWRTYERCVEIAELVWGSRLKGDAARRFSPWRAPNTRRLDLKSPSPCSLQETARSSSKRPPRHSSSVQIVVDYPSVTPRRGPMPRKKRRRHRNQVSKQRRVRLKKQWRQRRAISPPRTP
jgi:hypothetical protein